MALLQVLMWLVLPNPALLSGPDRCGVHDSSSSNDMSPWLQSLQCHNNFKTHVDCKWKAPTNTTLQVWLRENKGSSELCVPFKDEKTTEDGVVQCRYETSELGIGTNHAVFFMNNQTTSLCSSSKHSSLDLVQHLRARPPGGLTASEESDGSYRLRWSSPYSPLSSLNQNLSYQLSFRTQAEDGWTTEAVADTSVKLERQKLLPGHRYEARGSGQMSMEVQQNEVRETKSYEAVPLFLAPCPLRDRDYVCLPNRTLSRSTEDLTSHSSSGPKCPEQDRQHLNATLRPVQSDSRSGSAEPATRNQPSDYMAGPLPSWPQEGANSGYCQLPAAFTAPSK